MKEKGQVVIILLLIILVSLSVGLAVTQRSLTNIASSSKAEQSTRAFSAAESGIEQALYSGNLPNNADLGNQSTVTVKSSPPLPAPGQALEYPPVGREGVAQFWLADPNNLNCPNGATCYPKNTPLNIYFGNYTSGGSLSDPDTPAIEVTLVSRDNSGNYIDIKSDATSSKYFFDPLKNSRAQSNNFTDPLCGTFSQINTSSSPDTTTTDRLFRCRAQITTDGTYQPIMLRVRILYSNSAQALAVAPLNGNSLPYQAVIYTSTGISGQSQKQLQLFKMPYVVPFYFDYSVFSSGPINK